MSTATTSPARTTRRNDGATAAQITFTFVIVSMIVVLVYGIVGGFASRHGYLHGFCAGSNGTAINADTCNVNGQVVPVTGADTYVLQFTSAEVAFANGYCTAVGGTALSTEVCNVNGQVIPAPAMPSN